MNRVHRVDVSWGVGQMQGYAQKKGLVITELDGWGTCIYAESDQSLFPSFPMIAIPSQYVVFIKENRDFLSLIEGALFPWP